MSRPKSHGDSDCILQEWDNRGCLLVPGMKCEGWEGRRDPRLPSSSQRGCDHGPGRTAELRTELSSGVRDVIPGAVSLSAPLSPVPCPFPRPPPPGPLLPWSMQRVNLQMSKTGQREQTRACHLRLCHHLFIFSLPYP